MTKRWKRRCENCRWYEEKLPAVEEPADRYGYCFAAPPRPPSLRPIVSRKDRCAMWDGVQPEQWEELL